MGGLSQTEIRLLVNDLLWFFIFFVVAFGASKIEGAKKYSLISPTFFIQWAFISAGTILGYLIWILIDTSELTVTFDFVKFAFFAYLALALGPTAWASLGISEKKK